MTKCTLLLFSVASIVNAQTQRQDVNCTQWLNHVTCSNVQTVPQNPMAGGEAALHPIIDAMKASAEAGLKQQQLKTQSEQFEQELQLQKERLKLDQERLTFEQERQHVLEQPAQLEVDKVIQSLRHQYSDFSVYEGKILELAGSFLPGKTVTVYGYVEGLYIIAKHSADAKRPSDPSAPEPRQD